MPIRPRNTDSALSKARFAPFNARVSTAIPDGNSEPCHSSMAAKAKIGWSSFDAPVGSPAKFIETGNIS
jgi:hypothetical protein